MRATVFKLKFISKNRQWDTFSPHAVICWSLLSHLSVSYYWCAVCEKATHDYMVSISCIRLYYLNFFWVLAGFLLIDSLEFSRQIITSVVNNNKNNTFISSSSAVDFLFSLLSDAWPALRVMINRKTSPPHLDLGAARPAHLGHVALSFFLLPLLGFLRLVTSW